MPAPLQHVSSDHGKPCYRAHCNTSRCPCSAATRLLIPRAALLPRLPQHRQVPTHSGASHIHTPYVHPTDSRAPAPTATPPSANVIADHGQPCSRAHSSRYTCPFRAAHAHVPPAPPAITSRRPHGHGGSCSRAHLSNSWNPIAAADSHFLSSHGQSCSRAQLFEARELQAG